MDRKTETTMKKVPMDDIVIRERVREDLGDLNVLANSIKEYGMLAPIIVSRDMVLISGQRRLEACRLLGYDDILALEVDLDDEYTMFNIECQENLCRKAYNERELDKEIEMKKRYIARKLRRNSPWGRLVQKMKGFFRFFSGK